MTIATSSASLTPAMICYHLLLSHRLPCATLPYFHRLGDECFAIVPFWDLANHGVEPNTAFRADASGSLQLLALKDLEPDQEVLISYTGVWWDGSCANASRDASVCGLRHVACIFKLVLCMAGSCALIDLE